MVSNEVVNIAPVSCYPLLEQQSTIPTSSANILSPHTTLITGNREALSLTHCIPPAFSLSNSFCQLTQSLGDVLDCPCCLFSLGLPI